MCVHAYFELLIENRHSHLLTHAQLIHLALMPSLTFASRPRDVWPPLGQPLRLASVWLAQPLRALVDASPALV